MAPQANTRTPSQQQQPPFRAQLDKVVASQAEVESFLKPVPKAYGRFNIISYVFHNFVEYWAARPPKNRTLEAEDLLRAELPDAVRTYRKERDDFYDKVPKLLRKVEKSRTGGPLFREITSGCMKLLIVPFRKDEQNSEVIVDPEHTEDAVFLGMPQRDAKTGEEFKGAKLGTGMGTDATVLFTPSMWKGKQGPGTNADEVLFHELVHASRVMRGVQYFGLHVDQDYENREEYLAVVLTNIYLAENGQTKLRADHSFHDDNPKARILIHPEKFLDNPQGVNVPPIELIGSFKIRQPILYDALADIPKSVAWFNPIREYRERSKGFKLIDYP